MAAMQRVRAVRNWLYHAIDRPLDHGAVESMGDLLCTLRPGLQKF